MSPLARGARAYVCNPSECWLLCQWYVVADLLLRSSIKPELFQKNVPFVSLGAARLFLRAEIGRYGFCYFQQQATIEWQHVSHTVGGWPTDRTTKQPQLGMIGRVREVCAIFGACAWCWALDKSIGKCSRGQRLKDLFTGGCLDLRTRSDHLNGVLSGRNARGCPTQCPPYSSSLLQPTA